MKFSAKYIVLIDLCVLLGGMVYSCGSDNGPPDLESEVPNEPEDPNDDDPEGPGEPQDPVETNDPNTDYSPAFEGQTRINGVTTETTYTVTVFASGLSNPWGMAHLPDGRILVTEKAGTMRLVSTSGTVSSPITGIPAVNSSGQGGLLDVAVDPNFQENRMIYWSFSQNGPGGTATAVAKGRLSDSETAIEDAEVIYTAIPEFESTAHYGSRLAWDGEGNLFVSTGDRSSRVTRGEAQELDAALGKVLRITTDGAPASGNPFVGEDGVLPEIYSYGHRNVQGLAVHPVTGELWESELGPRGGDEVNLIEAGADYGWPTISYGLEYSGAAIGSGITQQNGMEQPVYYWDPVVSPSGMDFYSGNAIPEWTNNLFLGALSGQHIVRLVIEDDRVVGEERLLEGQGHRFRDILDGADGALYALTDGGGAVIYRIGL
ncbi:PQQ-dependent sugar dehydrogenase [Muricauda sp. SK9]|uniref:PQQ-dependent sugar dehydrogenase n=1 Tax=Flavobacteriaceae TaxID=49546 RepID=UPI001FE6F3AC|nr:MULTISPECIES: PQQ-dependent sugar dehydrogenase [Allomuricauda]MDC6386988.1 PQQ-dependent sugar dehydrogenase [Muricauda sp. SK9]